jgi:DNA-binding NarL/FixJ family response regulator
MATHRVQIKTLIVEDHFIALRGLCDVLEEIAPEVHVVATATNGDEALRAARDHPLDLAIIDVRLGSRPNGLKLTKDLAAAFPDLKILMYSADATPYRMKDAKESGARGYTVKGKDMEEFEQAITTVLAGGEYFPTQKLPKPDIWPLTKTEDKKILPLVAKTMRDVTIAKKLGIEMATVRTHVRNIMSKLSLRSRAALRREARRRYPPDLAE